MSQMKQLFIKFIEPLTKIEFYQNLLANILIIVAYILLGMIVIAISRKVVTKFLKSMRRRRHAIKLKEVRHFQHLFKI